MSIWRMNINCLTKTSNRLWNIVVILIYWEPGQKFLRGFESSIFALACRWQIFLTVVNGQVWYWKFSKELLLPFTILPRWVLNGFSWFSLFHIDKLSVCHALTCNFLFLSERVLSTSHCSKRDLNLCQTQIILRVVLFIDFGSKREMSDKWGSSHEAGSSMFQR